MSSKRNPFTGSFYARALVSAAAAALAMSGCIKINQLDKGDDDDVSTAGLPLGLSPNYVELPIGAAASQSFTGYGGSGTGYTYTALSGPGAVNSSSGLYTSSVGQRHVGDISQLRVTDSAHASSTATIKHQRLAVNGVIYATVSDGTSVYVGGDFTAANPQAAYGFLAADATTGVQVNPGLGSSFQSLQGSAFNGTVNAIAISGTTAYLGGAFTNYRGTAVQNLVKIDLVTGALDTTFTQATGPNTAVNAMVLSGNSLYIGGSFLTYRGDNRGYYVAKLNATTGAMDTTFNSGANSGPNGNVLSLALLSGSLYIGGNFTQYRGDTKGVYLVKADAATGVMDTAAFNTVAFSGPSFQVAAIAVSGTSLFIGGGFTSYRGDNRGYYVAKIDAATGVMDTAAFNTGASSGPGNSVYALAVSGSSLYIGGTFNTYRGDNRGVNLVKASVTTGAMDTAFNSVVGLGPSGWVNAIAVSGSSLYIGGIFTAYRNDMRARTLAKLDATTGVLDTANFNTIVGGGPMGAGNNTQVFSLALSGSTLYVGGLFATYRGTPVQNLAKFDIATGALDTTFTQATGPNGWVFALAVDGAGSLYIGGVFTQYRGDNRGYYVAKVDTTTGALDTANFNTGALSGPNTMVQALAYSAGSLYIGGPFTQYRLSPNGAYLVKVDGVTGVMDVGFNNQPGPDNSVLTIAVSGGSVYAGGSFVTYRTDPKGYRLVKLNAANGAMDAAFNTVVSDGPNGLPNAMAVMGGSLYVGGSFTQYRSDAKGYRLIKLDAATGVMDTALFNTVASSGPGNDVQALAAAGGYVYIGGFFGSYRGNANGSLVAKVDGTTGALENVNFNTVATTVPGNKSVRSMAISGSTVFAGGDFNNYRGNDGAPCFMILDSTSGAQF